jgi:hypothetical protein
MNTDLELVTDEGLNNKVHVFYNGQAWDLDFADLDIGLLSNDNEVRSAVAGALDVPASKLANFRLERHTSTADINMHPSAVFGFCLD